MSSVRASGRGRSWRVLLWATAAAAARWACARKRRTSATFAGRTWFRPLSSAAAPRPLSPLHATGLQQILCHHLHAKKFSRMLRSLSRMSTCTTFTATVSQVWRSPLFLLPLCLAHTHKCACAQSLAQSSLHLPPSLPTLRRLPCPRCRRSLSRQNPFPLPRTRLRSAWRTRRLHRLA